MTTLLSDHELTHHKLDQAREDVRTLHVLLSLLEPEQDDVAQGFADKLIALLTATQDQLERQATTLNRLTQLAAISDQRLQRIEEELYFLVGEPTAGDIA